MTSCWYSSLRDDVATISAPGYFAELPSVKVGTQICGYAANFVEYHLVVTSIKLTPPLITTEVDPNPNDINIMFEKYMKRTFGYAVEQIEEEEREVGCNYLDILQVLWQRYSEEKIWK